MAVVIFLLSSLSVSAQEVTDIPLSPVPSQAVSYDLPYSGALPGTPFYFLKALRDRLVSLLINDPLKKAQFDLLNSDKRIAAAMLLFDKKQEDLALSTISKSTNYFQEAVAITQETAKTRKEAGQYFDTLSQAARKHIEIIDSLQKRANEKNKKAFRDEFLRIQESEKNIESSKKKMKP